MHDCNAATGVVATAACGGVATVLVFVVSGRGRGGCCALVAAARPAAAIGVAALALARGATARLSLC